MDDVRKSIRAVARAHKRAGGRQRAKGKDRVRNTAADLRSSLHAILCRAIATAAGDAGCLQLIDPISGEISLSLRTGSGALGGEIASAAASIRSKMRWELLDTRLNVRAYLLRLPLDSSAGNSVGVAYIAGACPRKLNRNDRHTLAVLAKCATDLVLRARASERRQSRRERFARAQQACGLSTFEWDVTTDTIKGDATFNRLCGIPERAGVSFQTFISTVQWTYRYVLSDALAQATGVDSGRCRRVPLVFQPSGAEPSSLWVLGGCASFIEGRAVAFTGILVETRGDAPLTKQAAAATTVKAAESAKSIESMDAQSVSRLMTLYAGNHIVTPTALNWRRQTTVMEGLLASGRLGPRPHTSLRKRISLQSLLQDAVDIARPWIESGLHELVIDCPCPAPFIEVEPMRMGNALAELLINAAIYTPTGGHIAARVQESESQVEISVQDDGQGIASDNLPHLFNVYFAAGRSIQRAAGRLGVGLGVVRATVSLHGGSVVAFSPGVGRGSTFTVNLPQSSRAPNSKDSLSLADSPCAANDFRRRFLIAGDDTDAARSAVDLLREQGHEVLVSDDSVEAVTVARRHRPHIVLVNVSLPESLGYLLARRIRSLPLTPSPVVVPIGDVASTLHQSMDHDHECVVALSHFHLRSLQGQCAGYFHEELEKAAEQLRHSIDFPRVGAHQSAVAGATRLLQTLLVLLPVMAFSVDQCVELSARMSALRQWLWVVSGSRTPFV